MPFLPCPHCSAVIDVPVSRAGSELNCPTCQQLVAVPKLGELRKLDEASNAEVAVAAMGSSTGQRAIFALLLAISAVSAVAGTYCLVRYFAIEAPISTEHHIAQVEQAYGQISGAELVREWQEMEKFAPELSNRYVYQAIADERSGWLTKAVIGFAVATATAILATLAVVLGRSKSPDRRATA